MTLKLKSFAYLAGLSSVVVAVGSMPAMAFSGFTGVYAPSNFTFTSTPSNAGVEAFDLEILNPPAAGQVTLYSPDDSINNLGNLSPNGASSDWAIDLSAIDPSWVGTVSFNWSFNPLDNSVGDDSAGYFINNDFFLLAENDGTSNPQPDPDPGPIILNLSAGDRFGFRVSTLSNTGGAGAFTVTNFDATPVPLESDALPVVISLGFFGGGMWVKRKLKG